MKKTIFYNIIITYLLLELCSIVMIECFSYAPPPSFRITKKAIPNKHPKNADIDPTFGVWHIPNTSFHHVSECFDVYNYYNSYGARDKERDLKSADSRIMLIGDSFIEGYGVDTSSRLSNIMEEKLGIEVMNFGTSGDFGSTQMRLLYEKYGSQFEHDIVIVALFPENDFLDDKFTAESKRYKPYIIPDKDTFKLIYHVDSLHKSSWHPNNIGKPKIKSKSLIKYIRKYSYFYNALAHITRVLRFESRYHSFSTEELAILKYNLEGINKLRQTYEAKLILVTLPSRYDILYANKNKLETTPLNSTLSTFCKEKNSIYIDLLPAFQSYENTAALFLDCDGHWSAKGNQEAARLIMNGLKE